LTCAGASPRARLLGNLDRDTLRVALVGPPTPAWVLKLPAVFLRLPVYQGALLVLTARLSDGPNGTLVSGSVRPPIGNLLVLTAPVCICVAFATANPYWLVAALPVVLVVQLLVAFDNRRRLRNDAEEVMRTVSDALGAAPVGD
jgi:hypothetical protein